LSDVGAQEAEAPRLVVRLNPQGVIAPILRAIHAGSDVISVALPAIDVSDFQEPQERGSTIRFEGKQDIAERRITAANWLLVKGFQDLARSIREAMEEAYLYVDVFALQQGKTTWGEFQDCVTETKRKANKLSFPELLTAVGERLQSDLAFADEFRSLQKVRNHGKSSQRRSEIEAL